MDSAINALMCDNIEEETLAVKYSQLGRWEPQTKQNVMDKSSNISTKWKSLEPQPSQSTVGLGHKYSKSHFQQYNKLSLNTILNQQVVQTHKSSAVFLNSRHYNTTSLSPRKQSKSTDCSDYTFELLDGVKKVRFNLSTRHDMDW